jgi:hypothetical protein
MLRISLSIILSVLLLLFPLLAEAQTRALQRGSEQRLEFRLLDCPDNYWLQRGLNQTIHHWGGPSFSHSERVQSRKSAGLRDFLPMRPIQIEWTNSAQSKPRLPGLDALTP